jgi:hypothetical protein
LASTDPNPAILIAVSWQALNRALAGPAETRLCDCTVMVLFAGFYVEANLNYVVAQLGRTNDMRAFLGQPYPGLQDKLAWFYNEYVARTRAVDKKTLYRRGIRLKLRRRFPGFAQLYRFRNDLAHGIVNSSARSLAKAQGLRKQAKGVVASLFAIAARHGHAIPTPIDYYKAIGMQQPITPPNLRLQPTAAAQP